jgi:hypothetical protein
MARKGTRRDDLSEVEADSIENPIELLSSSTNESILTQRYE